MPLSRGIMKIRFNQDYGECISCVHVYVRVVHAPFDAHVIRLLHLFPGKWSPDLQCGTSGRERDHRYVYRDRIGM